MTYMGTKPMCVKGKQDKESMQESKMIKIYLFQISGDCRSKQCFKQRVRTTCRDNRDEYTYISSGEVSSSTQGDEKTGKED